MLIYIFTIIFVYIFAWLAQIADKKQIIIQNQDFTEKKVLHSKESTYYYIVLALILINVAGLRYYVGTDYGVYYNAWQTYADSFYHALVTFSEPGYRLICYIVTFIGKDGAYAIYICSLVTIGSCLYTIYKNTNQIFIATVLLLLIGFWYASFNAVRQCLAAAFVFAGYPYLKNRSFPKYMIYCFLGFLCHRSAICMIFPFFFVNQKINIRNIIIVFVCTIIILNSYDFLFHFVEEILDKQEFDLSRDNTYYIRSVNIFRVLVGIVPAVFFYVYFFVNNIKFLNVNRFYLNVLILNAVISGIGMNSPYLSRMNLYIYPFMSISISELLIHVLSKDRKIIANTMLLFYFCFFLFEVNNSGSLKNFHWIWDR